jgi:hypothetical protein
MCQMPYNAYAESLSNSTFSADPQGPYARMMTTHDNIFIDYVIRLAVNLGKPTEKTKYTFLCFTCRQHRQYQ